MAKSPASKPSTDQASKPYTVLARRYRSREFDELIGQEPIAQTLLNAIKTGRTAHAYLFCGTRGVGKTSMARIFAKALNATDDLKEKKAVGDAILRGDDLDVIEIDAASNRGIDDARELIAGSSLSPARSPYKIYIIDEVHQLTKDAFNALLKTMEEPPAHVKFILCTTEPHKVPATIQSRCQRFDFRAIPSGKIASHIRSVLKEEGVKANDEVVAQVARLGNGSMRDALSILDRLLAGGMDTLTVEHLEEMLGLPDHELIVNLVDAFIASDAAAALKAGDALLQKSAGVEQALDLLTDHLRGMMILAACGGEADFLDLSDEHRKTAARQADAFDAPAIVHMIALCDAVSRNARGSAAGRALFDAALVRLAMTQHIADIPALLAGGAPPSRGRAAAEIEAKKKAQALSPSQAVPRADRPVTSAQSGEATSPSRPGLTAEIKPVATASGHAVTVSHDEIWPRVLAVASERGFDRQCVEHLVFESFDGRVLRLSLDDGAADIARFVSGQIDRITELVRRATGRSVKIILDADNASSIAGTSAPGDGPMPDIVRKAAELFGATVVSVEESGRL